MGLFGNKEDNIISYGVPAPREKTDIVFTDIASDNYTTIEVYKDQLPLIEIDIINVLNGASKFIRITDTTDCANIIAFNILSSCIITF